MAPASRSGLKKAADRGRATGHLKAEQRIAVLLIVGRSVLDPDLSQIDVELIGEQHRLRRIDALPHLHLRQGHGHGAIPSDPDEGARREIGALPARGRGGRLRQGDLDQQAAPQGCTRAQDGAPRQEEFAGIVQLRLAGRVWLLKEHLQPPCLPVAPERAACLIAARIRT